MRPFLLLIFILGFASSGHSQRQDLDKKTRKYYNKAYYFYGFGKYEQAGEWLDKALERSEDCLRCLYLQADIHNIHARLQAELDVYERILKIDTADMKALMNTGDLYLKNGRFEKAYEHYTSLSKKKWIEDRFMRVILKNRLKSAYALNLYRDSLEIELIPVQPANSESDEYWPFLSPDGNYLYFTRIRKAERDGGREYYTEENIHMVRLNPDAARNDGKLPDYINGDENEGAQCITQDGKTLFFTACNQMGRGDCNLYYCEWKKGQWGRPKRLPSPLNTPYKESQPSISYDGKMLFFSSDRPGGFGGMDIWVSRMNRDSQWAKPQNLGQFVNSPGNEESPFIHIDNKTLYFSSTGHPGLGRGDLFTIRLGENKPPTNLGYPINNHLRQLGIYVSLDGEWAYYASQLEDGQGGLDIVKFRLPNRFKPTLPRIINGITKDAKTGEPIRANIRVYRLDQNEQVLNYRSLKTGAFQFGLPERTDFAIYADCIGYLPYTHYLNATDSFNKDTIVLELSPIYTDNSFALRSVFFEFDSSNLSPKSRNAIQYLSAFLSQYPSLKIEIGGHTDDFGNESYNFKLSQERALAVFKALEREMGADLSDRVKIKGYGATEPVATNDTEEGRRQNRRTEIKILEFN